MTGQKLWLAISARSRRLDTLRKIKSRAAEPGSREPELIILPGAGTQIKNQEPEPKFSLKFRSGVGVMAI